MWGNVCFTNSPFLKTRLGSRYFKPYFANKKASKGPRSWPQVGQEEAQWVLEVVFLLYRLSFVPHDTKLPLPRALASPLLLLEHKDKISKSSVPT
jgi:hypothetical protein